MMETDNTVMFSLSLWACAPETKISISIDYHKTFISEKVDLY